MKASIRQNKNVLNDIILNLLVILAFSTTLLGCGGHYGGLVVSDDVKNQFESYQILPDHRYYYSGSFARPRAVIGVHEAYTLKTKLWVPVDLTPQQLKEWVEFFGPGTKQFKTNNGSEILADNGEKIGIWYALIDWKDWAMVKMIDDRVVSISTPISSQNKSSRSGFDR
jgi:hypothetical protein